MSTTLDDERDAIESRFTDAWGTTTPIKYENVTFEEPKDVLWVSLNTVTGQGKSISLVAGETERQPGVIFIQIFAPKGSGSKGARQLADKAADIFRTVRFSKGNSGEILTQVPSLMQIGIRDGWFQMNVRVPYWRTVRYGS